MLDTSNYYRNANQNYDEAPPHTAQNGHHWKGLQVTNAGEGVQRQEPSYGVGKNVNWCSHYEKVWSFLKKLRTELTYNPAIPLLGIYPEKILIQKNTRTHVQGSIIYDSQDMEAT